MATPQPAGKIVSQGQVIGAFGGPTTSAVFDQLREGQIKALLARHPLQPQVIAGMRRHYQIIACLNVTSLPLRLASWQIEADDDAVTEFVTETLTRIMPHVMKSAAKTLAYGYSPNVLVWDIDPTSGGLTITQVRDLDPSTCKPLVDHLGDYQGFVQYENQLEQARIPEAQSLWLVEGMESGSLYGRPLLDGCIAPWNDFLAYSALKGRALERFGAPLVIVKHPAGQRLTNPVEVAGGAEPVYEDHSDIALQIARNITSQSAIAIPSGQVIGPDGKPMGPEWSIEFLESTQDSAADFDTAELQTDRRIARAFTVPSLLIDNSETGSFALSSTQQSVWQESLRDRLEELGRQLQTQLVDRLVAFNFPPGTRARLRFTQSDQARIDRLWAVMDALVTGGRVTPDVEALAGEIGLELGPDPVPVAVQVEPSAQLRHDHGHNVVELAATVGDVSGLPDWQQPDPEAAPTRDLTDQERRLGVERVGRVMDRAEATAITALDGLLVAGQASLGEQITAAVAAGDSSAVLSALARVNVGDPAEYAAVWEALQGTVWGEALASVARELPRYRDQIPTTVAGDAATTIAVRARLSAERWVEAFTSDIRLGLTEAWQSGVRGAAGLAASVSDRFTRARSSEGATPRLATRHLSSQALTGGRNDAVDVGDVPIQGAQFSAVLDHRTCELCRRLDEQTISVADLDYLKFEPPLHWNCRCFYVWITVDEETFVPTWDGVPGSLVDRFGPLVSR